MENEEGEGLLSSESAIYPESSNMLERIYSEEEVPEFEEGSCIDPDFGEAIQC